MSGTRLTRGAILYVSVGFTQDCLLQVLSLQRPSNHTLAMVVYDGLAYAGALYRLPPIQPQPDQPIAVPSLLPSPPGQAGWAMIEEGVVVRQLDVIEVTAMPVGPNEPIEVKNLRVVASGVSDILGQQILSIQEYMRRRKFSLCLKEEDAQAVVQRIVKRVKTDSEQEGRSIDEGAINGTRAGEVQIQESGEPMFTDNLLRQSRDNSPQRSSIVNEEINKLNQREEEMEKSSDLRQELGKGLKSTDHSHSHPSPLRPPSLVDEEIPKLGEVQQERQVEKQVIVLQPEIVQQFHPVQQQEQQLVLEAKSFDPRPLPNDCLKTTLAPFPNFPNKQTVIQLLQEENDVTEVKAVRPSRIIDLEEEISQPTKPSRITRMEGVPQSATKRYRSPVGEEHVLIADLYQRMHRFRLLCRINHISTFTTQKGKACTRMMVVDERGDEIMCHLFQKANQKHEAHELQLLRGRTYYLENGEVEQDDTGCLSVSVPWSGIRLTSLQLDPFNPSKMRRVPEVQSIDASDLLRRAVGGSCNSINSRKAEKEINVCGILRGLRDQPKLVNNQFRTQGVLIEPDHGKAITFCLFLDELSTFPKEGAVISLHNMRVAEYKGTFKLESSKRSYYLVQSHCPLSYLSDLQESERKGSWKLSEYRNLSQVCYISRTIAELKQLLCSMGQQDQCYSDLDCSVANISEKREYMACVSCQHETKPSKGNHTYCFHCKKIERCHQRFLFRAEVADGTGSLELSLANPEADVLLGVGPVEYGQMTRAERQTLTQLSAFQNLALRVRSERIVGGSTHFCTRAEKVSHRRALQQIKEQAVLNRTKNTGQW